MDDVIYREDALERLRSIPSDLGRRELDDAIKAIENTPSAQKKGHWLYPTDVKGFCRCECCGALWGRDLYENRFFKYCPRCGADMRGDEDG